MAFSWPSFWANFTRTRPGRGLSEGSAESLRGSAGVRGIFRGFSGVVTCDPSIPLEEFLGPSGPKLETELKMSSRGLPAPESKKLKTESKRVEKVEKEFNFPFSTLFRLCF